MPFSPDKEIRMKLLSTFVIAAAAMMTVPAIAMAKDCGARPAKLSLPDGASASEEQMKATAAKFPSYATAVTTYRRCLADEVKSAGDEYESVSADWKKQGDLFKAQPAK
jgi:hypothetical protein